MFYWLYVQFASTDYVPVLNLLKYQTFRTGLAIFTAQIVVVALGSRFIRWMKPGRARASRCAPRASSATSSKNPARRPWAG